MSALNQIIEQNDLSFDEAYALFNEMLNESEIRIAAILAALQTKGYTPEEIAGFAKAMRDNAIKIEAGSVADTCGTGGDGSNTINVSTAVAILLSCFTKVAKHGNVSITSKSGSANVLQAFGIRLELTPEEAKKSIEEKNFAFLFAPLYHPALKKIMPVRKQLGIKTIFNILGPLANPAQPEYQLLGVNSASLLPKVAHALKLLGIRKALVVYGGMDEVSPKGETMVAEVGREVEFYTVTPEDFGIEPVDIHPCNGADESAERIKKVFSGAKNDDTNFILVNASAALYTAGIASDFREGVEIARNAIEDGMALRKLEELRQI
ncbi:anthranilate phosphoribosyltransferase [Archaeoglobus veneficus]|uniref:Anthranilate phosphoribosyltransferase n=1 Tax=Archaeoglobus veneficus (strain DSM 11195 / SNP6) TaxID=693661 RepID=F2KS87_ARCVS|nr:anthranilate phosphoribosyltransferase [Archaeoglobus veneficus]AEA48026.1 Anthranilate phosphoribosyltransferase [Archaeoglobus veneficus SNP6]